MEGGAGDDSRFIVFIREALRIPTDRNGKRSSRILEMEPLGSATKIAGCSIYFYDPISLARETVTHEAARAMPIASTAMSIACPVLPGT